MSASVIGGPRSWKASRDDEGHREYRVTHLVATTSVNDGPQIVMDAAGLPFIGSVWAFGNDLDLFAWCRPNRSVSIHQEIEGDPNKIWRAESIFSTKPLTRCQDQSIEDPLLEPDRIGGSFINYTEEAVKDRQGRPIKSSSHEMFRGPQVEFDKSRPTVVIEQNRAALGLETFSQMINTVNNAPLWGVPARCVKLRNVTWSRVLFGTCDFFFVRTLEFDINQNEDGTSGFDRDILDEGTKVLNGHWDTATGEWTLDDVGGSAPNAGNPAHFKRFQDRDGNITRTLLNGAGLPLDGNIDDTTDPFYRHVEKYHESNMLLLGIPTFLG